MEDLYIVDSLNYIYKSYHAIKPIPNSKGMILNALYGFARSLEKIIKDRNVNSIVCIFDAPEGKNKRLEISKNYKSSRKPMEENLALQLPLIKKYTSLRGIKVVEIGGYEGDDIVGSIALHEAKNYRYIYICSEDKDFFQLINNKILVYNKQEFNNESVKKKYGIDPTNFVDYLALVGDASDNISGVKGIGGKKASLLLNQYETIEKIYENLDDIEPGTRKKLIEDKENAFIGYKLAKIVTSVETIPKNNEYGLIEREGLFEFLDDLGLSSLIVDRAKELLKRSNEIYIYSEKDLFYLFCNNKICKVRGKDLKKLPLKKKDVSGCKIKDLMHKGIEFATCFDILIASHLLGKDKPKYTNVKEMVKATEELKKELSNNKLDNLFYRVEMPLIPILYQMETNGISVDLSSLHKIKSNLENNLTKAKNSIFELAEEEFNLNSPKEVGKILFEKLKLAKVGKKTTLGHSTDARVLNQLKDHKIVSLILEYRNCNKLLSQLVGIEKSLDENDTVHTTFHQNVTVTGRLSSSNPNLQNIPESLRVIFVAKKNNLFVSVDYSQIELRLLAHFSQDPTLIESFDNNVDVHKECASGIFGLPPEQITKEMRQIAKTVNFGIVYGQTAYGLSTILNVGIEESKYYIESYFKKYPGVKTFLQKIEASTKKSGTTTTLMGRKRTLDLSNKPQAIRFATNTPIQGSQAEIIKMATIKLAKPVANAHGKILLQIHDELIFEFPKDQVEEIKPTIKQIMEKIVVLSVPLLVDICVGKNWGLMLK